MQLCGQITTPELKHSAYYTEDATQILAEGKDLKKRGFIALKMSRKANRKDQEDP